MYVRTGTRSGNLKQPPGINTVYPPLILAMVLKGYSLYFVLQKNTVDHEALNSRDRVRAMLKSAHNEIHKELFMRFTKYALLCLGPTRSGHRV